MASTITLVLGAGASRGVSYANKRRILSPLDSDFFELLQKIEPASKDEPAVAELIQWILESGDGIWSSMERTFYTLYMRARMSEVLFPHEKLEANVARLLNGFTRAIDALLREAHGKSSCDYHIDLLQKLRSTDGVVSFNYDLVAERAIKKLPSIPAFGDWVYGFADRPEDGGKVPTLHKLHGSVNWLYDEDEEHFKVRQNSWKDFDEEPGYRAHSNRSLFAIMLPYWHKKVEEHPWSQIFKQTAAHLNKNGSIDCLGIFVAAHRPKSTGVVEALAGSGAVLLEGRLHYRSIGYCPDALARDVSRTAFLAL